MNKKGFTLVELLAVITLIAIIAGMAVPNVMSSIENSKKNTFLLDAKRMVAKASSLISLDREARQDLVNNPKIYLFKDLNAKGEFEKDADNSEYVGNSMNDGDDTSFVAVTFDNDSKQYKYCICVQGSKRQITGENGNCNPSDVSSPTGCIDSDELTIGSVQPRIQR